MKKVIGTIIRAVVPQHLMGKVLLIVSVVMTAAIYFCRLHADDIVLSLYFLLVAPVIFLIGCFLLFHVWATWRYSFKHDGHPMPAIVLLGGSLLAVCSPVRPSYYEERLFSSSRAEYEQLVELARTGQLQHDDNCSGYREYAAPSGYEKLVGEGSCVYVYSFRGVVEFRPRSYYRPIVYSETALTEQLSKSCYNGVVYVQLDEHWCICQRD